MLTGANTGNSLAPAGSGGSAAPAFTSDAVSALRKGLSVAEVEALLEPAGSANEVQERTMTVMKRGYKLDGRKVTTSFVGGVLIDVALVPL